MFAVTSWLWLPSFRSSYVQQTWIWDRKHDSCMRSYSTRMPCVRPFFIHSWVVFHTHFFFLYIFLYFSPILLWIYGRRIRMSSKYAGKPVHRPTTVTKVVESEESQSPTAWSWEIRHKQQREKDISIKERTLCLHQASPTASGLKKGIWWIIIHKLFFRQARSLGPVNIISTYKRFLHRNLELLFTTTWISLSLCITAQYLHISPPL